MKKKLGSGFSESLGPYSSLTLTILFCAFSFYSITQEETPTNKSNYHIEFNFKGAFWCHNLDQNTNKKILPWNLKSGQIIR